ncbi:unnamed protein product, partial [Discosporangium mesarthrocarpum]
LHRESSGHLGWFQPLIQTSSSVPSPMLKIYGVCIDARLTVPEERLASFFAYLHSLLISSKCGSCAPLGLVEHHSRVGDLHPAGHNLRRYIKVSGLYLMLPTAKLEGPTAAQ